MAPTAVGRLIFRHGPCKQPTIGVEGRVSEAVGEGELCEGVVRGRLKTFFTEKEGTSASPQVSFPGSDSGVVSRPSPISGCGSCYPDPVVWPVESHDKTLPEPKFCDRATTSRSW